MNDLVIKEKERRICDIRKRTDCLVIYNCRLQTGSITDNQQNNVAVELDKTTVTQFSSLNWSVCWGSGITTDKNLLFTK